MEGEKSADPRSVAGLESHAGQSAGGGRVYLPLESEFLLSGRSLTFDVYTPTSGSRFQRLLRSGRRAPEELLARIREEGKESRLYVPADQLKAMARLQEDVVAEMLDAKDVPVETKCRAVRGVTTSLSRLIFESPTPRNIDRQRMNVSHLVDLALRTPSALGILLGLTDRDQSPAGHMANVGLYGLAVAHHPLLSGGSEDKLRRIAVAFFLYDIGKSRVPPEILNKTAPLNEEEWEEIRKHPAHGRDLLAEAKSLTPEAEVVTMQHHERLDGSGYPRGLGGDGIHPYARVCSVLDAFDALTTGRPYHEALPPYEALACMKEQIPSQFDPETFKSIVLLLKKGD